MTKNKQSKSLECVVGWTQEAGLVETQRGRRNQFESPKMLRDCIGDVPHHLSIRGCTSGTVAQE